MVHRRQQRPSLARRSWSAKKRGPIDEPEDHALGRSRGGFGTKFHLVTDGKGTALAVAVTPGQSHESKSFESTLEAVPLAETRWPDNISGDKGYSYPRIRQWLQDHGIGDVIARRKDQRLPGDEEDFDHEMYRRRNVVERCVGWLKECRRICTRYEKLAVNFLAMLKIAMIRRYLGMMVRAG